MSFVIQRKNTRQICVGDVKIGGGAPVAVQSMTNTRTQDAAATVAQILRLEQAGCEIVRVAVPDESAAASIGPIKNKITIPLIADIHFDYKLAIRSAESGADALRINPGNIGSHQRIKAVVDCAKAHHIPIRIGVNAGSLEKDLIKKHGGVTVAALVESALKQIDLMDSLGFASIKLAIKSSDVRQSIAAYRQLSAATDFPLHVGITEAGGLFSES